MKTFKPGDYCRFNTEEIPSIIALLEVNTHPIWLRLKCMPYHDVILCDEAGDLFPSSLDMATEMKNANELSRHDFMVTALRLSEGDGMRSDRSERYQFEHIYKSLLYYGIDVMYTNFTIALGFSVFYSNSERPFGCTQHLDYSEWCKRLNIEPVNVQSEIYENLCRIDSEPIHIPDVGEKVDQLSEAKRLLRDLADLQNGAPLETYREEWEKTMNEVYSFLDAEPQMTPSNTLTLPDGTTVDLTKPFEVRTDKGEWLDIFDCYVGFNNHSGCHIVSSPHSMNSFKHIRNKPEPKFKPGDKVWFTQKGIINSPWYFGTIAETKDGSIVVNHQNYEPFFNVAIRPAFIDGKLQYPPFNH